MIRSFRSKRTQALFQRLPVPQYKQIEPAARRKLIQLHSAFALEELAKPPGNRLEALHGDRAGQHSIRVNDRWRICFEWRAGHAYQVEIVDYH